MGDSEGGFEATYRSRHHSPEWVKGGSRVDSGSCAVAVFRPDTVSVPLMSIKPWNVGVEAPRVRQLRVLATALTTGTLVILLIHSVFDGPALYTLALVFIVLSLAVRTAAAVLQRRIERGAWRTSPGRAAMGDCMRPPAGLARP
jgi:hypothetical protein